MAWQRRGRVHRRYAGAVKKLIRATVEAAEGSGPQPDDLQAALLVDRYGAQTVLGGGAVPVQYLRKLAQLSGIYEAVRAYRNASGKEIHRVDAMYGRTLEWLMLEGYL